MAYKANDAAYAREIVAGSTIMRAVLSLLTASFLALQASAGNSTTDAAAHVIYSYPGGDPPAELIDIAGQCMMGGLILFSENVNSNVSAFIGQIQDAYSAGGCDITGPLLIVTDQEGGQVVRLPGGPVQSEKEIGESPNPTALAAAAGTQAADACNSYSVNGNLAPVLDVFREPGDFDDQYQRSYSNDSDVVDECGASFVPAQQGQGVVATAKHFPGLGAATADEDTDEGPVTINLSLAELRATDEAPYGPAIKAGIKMVMPSWALYPALDDKYPSGLSSKWIQDELRGRLGFTGVTISDAIEAGALQAFGEDPGHRAVLACNAGMDLILAAQLNVTQGQVVVQALAAALESGTLDSAAFGESMQRISTLRGAL